jgi:hypothetical protein
MKHALDIARFRIIRTIFYIWLSVIISVAPAHAETISYTLDNIFLEDGTRMTGSFDWTYTAGDFEGGSGVFTALVIPWQPGGTLPPLQEPGMNLIIEFNQIEISLDGNFHDWGLNVNMKFVQPLSPTQASPLDLGTSFFECCGNGFHDQPFVSGSINPVIAPVPTPSTYLLMALGITGLLIYRRSSNKQR